MIGEEDMDTPLGDGYDIYTGSAEGTDALAEQCARQWGMDVSILIPPGHVRTKTISPLSTAMMENAVPFMRAAAKNWGKTCPSTNHPWPYSSMLLARNYWIVNQVRATYAFGRFVDPMNPCTLKGGTGWTVQLDIEIKKLLSFQVSQNLTIRDGQPVTNGSHPSLSTTCTTRLGLNWYPLLHPTNIRVRSFLPLLSNDYMVPPCWTRQVLS